MAKKNNCGDLFLSLNDSIYKNTVFQRFFEKNDPIVMGWAENVLAKLIADGVLPTFLQKKENEDFKAFWGTITHLFALTVIYARQYKEIDSNKILFDTFIQNKGITTDLVDSQEQMEYLFYNYLKEYNKRGRLDIVSKEGEILGELLRLIRYTSQDEFIFTLLQPQDTGWVMGYSSPSWKRTNTINNITKAYEFTESVKDLSKYPLLRSSSIQIAEDKDILRKDIQVMVFSGIQTVGIQSDSSQTDKYIPIDPSINYEISLKIKVNGILDQNLKFGAQGFDNEFNQVNFLVLEEGEYKSESNWFHSNTFLNLRQGDIYYEIKGIILAHNRRYFTSPILNFISGRAISMKPEMKYISPVFIQERSSSTDPMVYLYDFKVKPLDLPFEQGYLGARDIIASYYKNNAFQREDTINSFLKKYLLSYKNIFKGKIFEPLQQINLTFKVFSDRNQYLPGTEIAINGEIYKTNANGEMTIKIYPGLYNYDVSAEGFDDVRNAVLEVDNKDKVEYVQMIGSAYQRTVSFSVRSNNIPVEGVKITFIGVVGYTGANGLAFFEAFPGIYEYKIEKRDFVTINRNVSITEDTTIDIEFVAIPYFNVSFRVRDVELPVPGVAVIITGDFDGDGVVTEQPGATNDLGIATGFVMRAGTYQYRASKDMYITKTGDFSVINNATIEIALMPVPRYNITFIIKSFALPVPGTTVTFNGKQQITDNAGKAVFREPNGEYNYGVTKTEFLTQSGAVTVQDADVVKNIEFVQIGYTVKFTVASKGKLLSGAKISIGTETISTNASGEAEFIRVSGNYNWSTSLNGYYPETGVVLVNGTAKTITVELILITYNAIFTVRINGVVLANQPVVCNGLIYNTDSQGIAKFNLPPGSYGWSVSRTAYDPQSGTVLLVDRDVSVNVDLLATKGTVVFTARDVLTAVFLGNVAITVNGETKYTAITGQVSFVLVLGNYNFISALLGYNSNSGTFPVTEGISQKEILMSKEAAKIWSLVFRAKEGNTLLPGVNIALSNGRTGVTNDAGESIFSVISGSYNYKASANAFFPELTGTVTVSESNTNVALSFVRKMAQITFSVKDSLNNQPVNGVAIEFNNVTRSTNSLGETTFTGIPMSSNSLKYLASKNPPYQDLTGTVYADTDSKIVTLVMGQYTYSTIFTVKTNTGAPISGASVVCNGKSGTTNSSGQVTISGYINGTYNYTVTHGAHQTVTGTTTISNANSYPNIVMIPLANTINIRVQFTPMIPLPGMVVTIGSYSKATDSNGIVSFSLTNGSYSYSTDGSQGYIPVTGNIVVNNLDQAIFVTVEDTFAIAASVAYQESIGLPILNTGESLSKIKVDWGDGNTTTGQISHSYSSSGEKIIKISTGDLTKSSDPTVNCIFWGGTGNNLPERENFLRIVKWFNFIPYISFGKYSFIFNKFLTSLGSVESARYSISSCEGIFMLCPSLKAIPQNFFKNAVEKPRNFRYAFQQSGLEGVLSSNFMEGVEEIETVDYMFAYSNITKVLFSFPSTDIGTGIGTFRSCRNLTECKVFENTLRVSSLAYTFTDCSNLSVWPLIGKVQNSLSMNNCFQNCKSLPANTITYYLPRKATHCVRIFMGCSSITSFAPGLFGPEVTTIEEAFSDCSKLADIGNTKLSRNPEALYWIVCKDASGAYANCTALLTVPAEHFSGCTAIEFFYRVFAGCTSLDFVNLDAFKFCFPRSFQEAFKGCVKLRGFRKDIFSWKEPISLVNYFVAASCTDYRDCFNGCTKLLAAPSVPLRSVVPVNETSIWNWGGKTVSAHGIGMLLPNSLGTGCFRGCTNIEGGLGAVPSNWK